MRENDSIFIILKYIIFGKLKSVYNDAYLNIKIRAISTDLTLKLPFITISPENFAILHGGTIFI